MTRTTRPIHVGLLALAALSLLAARSPRKAYLKVYKEHTRHSVIYFEFATALNLRATLLTAAMRDALQAERKRLMDPDDENTADFAARMQRDLAGYHEVVFSADSSVESGDRFGTTDAHWNLRLRADSTDQPLVAVERIRRPTPVHKALYPHNNQWSDLWIARFERTVASPRRVELHIGSGYGNDTLVWTP